MIFLFKVLFVSARCCVLSPLDQRNREGQHEHINSAMKGFGDTGRVMCIIIVAKHHLRPLGSFCVSGRMLQTCLATGTATRLIGARMQREPLNPSMTLHLELQIELRQNDVKLWGCFDAEGRVEI